MDPLRFINRLRSLRGKLSRNVFTRPLCPLDALNGYQRLYAETSLLLPLPRRHDGLGRDIQTALRHVVVGGDSTIFPEVKKFTRAILLRRHTFFRFINYTPAKLSGGIRFAYYAHTTYAHISRNKNLHTYVRINSSLS